MFQQVFGIGAHNTSRTFARMLESSPELREEGNPLWITFKFPGRGQQETPVADAHGIVRISMLLPCRAAASVKEKICQRLWDYLGASHEALHAALAAPPALASAAPQSEATPQASGLEGLAELTDADTSRIRKTNELPSRASVFDTFQVLFCIRQDMCSSTFQRLSRDHEEVRALCSNFKFPSRGQRETPVADARGIVRIIFACWSARLLPTVGVVLECVRVWRLHPLCPTLSKGRCRKAGVTNTIYKERARFVC